MSSRSARVRYQDTLTSSSPLQCGLPQGSPVLPILFLLYTEPIYRLGNPQGRFGYADDIAILSVGDTVDETAAMASRAIDEMVRWGATNGVSFDSKKTEVMHFSRSKLRTAPAVRHGDIEKHPESALRWLGIWLDSRLSFRIHVEKWAAKAKAIAYHLRGLTNTIHGPLPSAVQSAIRAYVEPVQSLDPLSLVIYSDGSLSSQGAASYGFAIHQDSLPILHGSGRLGPAEVFDAEATGALEGLKAALNLQESVSRNIIICLDNLAAATCLRGIPSDSSQDVFLEFQALAASHGATEVRWVPGHADIPGNEQADKLAKAGSSAPEPEGARPTLAYLRRIARQKPKEAFET
ncbi:hypothetical protein BFJ66_g12393 [Fusarium oxysporum f. sp. cepae]|uniref:Reverse transcriptase n=1 Tax=Fusarium oxysporum f. sp. cepae TaxID=396571 RepID=A0A3L6NT58_FUSOX|nr:hypothetical protein BFJ65_g4824 [Fusarium oxysporum f. sp. cepae]RKK38642.1 hypothetical protein BFJ66_g12393 [Fusarium oxysporum f. sp. cepae]